MRAFDRSVLGCGLTLVSAIVGSQAIGQQLVTNGGFEQPVLTSEWTQRVRASTFGGWNVDDVGQGIVHVGAFGRPGSIEGNQCVELNFYDACGISQVLATEPGVSYHISFMLAGQNDAGPDIKTMRVEWGGSVVATASWSRSGSGGQWEHHSYQVVASSTSTVLHFFGETNVDGGPYLDAVSVVRECRADFNNDQTVDFFDYLDFVAVFAAQNSTADFNGDGIIDFFDYLDFVDVFSRGC